MAYTLPDHPSEVLKFVDENNVNSICGMPFIEPTGDEINNYYLKARTAIMAANPDIPWKKRCLSIMDNIMKKGLYPLTNRTSANSPGCISHASVVNLSGVFPGAFQGVFTAFIPCSPEIPQRILAVLITDIMIMPLFSMLLARSMNRYR